MDPQANASTGLGVDVSPPKIESVYDILINNKNINDCIKKTSVDYLDILPSCSKLAGAEIELVGMLTRESFLKLLKIVMENINILLLIVLHH